MTMHRCYAPPDLWSGSSISLPDDEGYHLLHVLRATPGERVVVFDGKGRETDARLVEGRGNRAVVEPEGTARIAALPVSITLIQALPKGKRMDLIVEKATELGVAAVYPVVTERVVSRPKQGQALARRERWQRIAISAAKQCGTALVPEIGPVSAYSERLTECGGPDLFLVGALSGEVRSLGPVLKEAHRAGVKRLCLLVGPEGDLSPGELDEAVAAGAVPVSFGPLVLRVETAALYGLSVLAYEFLQSHSL